MERVDKFISQRTSYTRKEIKQLIQKGDVLLNNLPTKAKVLVKEEDKISIFNREINKNKYTYIMLNKPTGYLTANKSYKAPAVMDLVAGPMIPKDLTHWGRLDRDTEGLLICSNDGILGFSLLNGKKHVPKTYYVKTDKAVDNDLVNIFKNGIDLQGTIYYGDFQKIDDFTSYLTIYSGIFHQVKRMYEKVGLKVTYLKRVSFGNLKLDPTLETGQWRYLTNKEIEKLQKLKDQVK